MKPIVDIKIRHINDAVWIIVFFENNYGASIVSHKSSCRNEKLFEIAVIKGTSKSWQITYDTPITSDILRYQTSEDINNVLEKISNL